MKKVIVFLCILLSSSILHSQNIDFKTFIRNDYSIFTNENVEFLVEAPIRIKKIKIKEIKEYQIEFEYDSLQIISKKSERLLNTIRFDTTGHIISFNHYKFFHDELGKTSIQDSIVYKESFSFGILDGKYLSTNFYEYHEYRDFSTHNLFYTTAKHYSYSEEEIIRYHYSKHLYEEAYCLEFDDLDIQIEDEYFYIIDRIEYYQGGLLKKVNYLCID